MTMGIIVSCNFSEKTVGFRHCDFKRNNFQKGHYYWNRNAQYFFHFESWYQIKLPNAYI